MLALPVCVIPREFGGMHKKCNVGDDMWKGLLVLDAPFLQCKPHLAPGGSGVLADLARIDEEFRKAWFPNFCCSGQRDTTLEEFNEEVDEWLPVLLEAGFRILSTGWLCIVVRIK